MKKSYVTGIRAALFALAVSFTVIGVYRNEVADVFKKAISL